MTKVTNARAGFWWYRERMDRPLLLPLVLMLSQIAAADVIRLKHGGEVRGTIVSAPQAAEVEVETLSGIRIAIDRDQTVAIVMRSLENERYVEMAKDVENSVEARLELAEWCRANRVRSGRLEQFRKILALDADHLLAREALGHVLVDGVWLTRDEKMRADGFVKVGRRWVSAAEAALMEQIDENSERAKAWFPKAIALRDKLETPDLLLRRPVLGKIASNSDPTALAAWVRIFASHPSPEVRMACVVALSKMKSSKAIRPLAKFAVLDPIDDVREAAVEAMHPDHRDIGAQVLAEWLSDENNALVQRAAIALESLGDDAAVVLLIRALETAHWQVVQYTDQTPSFSVGGGEIGFGGQAATLPPEVMAGLLTGQYPNGIPGVTAGRVRTKRVRVAVRNPTVLNALIAITGENFGYDERRWSAWWRRR